MKRKFKMSNHKGITAVSLVVLVLLMVFLGGSVALQQQKKATCRNVMEVWQDVGHLLSQKQTGTLQLSHGFSSLHRYLFSNLLDGSLYEWRLLEQEGKLPQSPDTRYLSWSEQDQDKTTQPQEGTNVVPVLLTITTSSTTFHDNFTELDYTHQVDNLEVDGRVLYTYQDGQLLWSGYTSQVTISSYVTDTPQDTKTEKQTFQGTSFGHFSSLQPVLDADLTLGAGQDSAPTLDCGTLRP